jgi:hypothetical protein
MLKDFPFPEWRKGNCLVNAKQFTFHSEKREITKKHYTWWPLGNFSQKQNNAISLNGYYVISRKNKRTQYCLVAVK